MDALEKVETIRTKCNVSYTDAKAALDAADGNVLGAIIWLESQGKTQTTSAHAATESAPVDEPSAEMVAAQAAYDKKGEDVQVLDLTELSDVCDYFVLATGTNNRQVDSIVDEIEEKVAEACGEHPFSIEGREQKTWMLMDYGSVVVHVFTPEARDFYRLEKLWGDAPQLPLNLL